MSPVRPLSTLLVGLALVLGGVACSGAGTDGAPDTAAGQASGTPAGPAAESAAAAPAEAPCTAPASWFPHAQTPKPDDEADFDNNCDFHLWSVQMFLWLTQTMPDGQLRFETFARPAALFPPDGSGPPPWDQAAGGDGRVVPRVTKSDDPTLLDEVSQAGSLGMLVDPSGRAVYYSMYVNDVFYDFVRENRFYDPQVLAAAPDDLDFPVGALELKASWKILDGSGDEAGRGWYTRTMTVAELSRQGVNVVVDPSRTETVEVALVGLHVAGVVKDHPELIWATFGHRDNAPTLTDYQLDQYLNPDSRINDKPVSDRSYTFYRAGTTFVKSNQNNAGLLELTDPEAQTLTPVTDAFTQYAQGGGDAQNRENVRTLDDSTREQLDDPVFRTYEYGGAIWLAATNGLVPNSTQQDLVTGSIALSNVTMETFTQKVLNQRNCFGCHNTMQRFPPEPGTGVAPLPGKNLNVSHILVNHYFQASQRQAATADGGTGPDPAAAD